VIFHRNFKEKAQTVKINNENEKKVKKKLFGEDKENLPLTPEASEQ